MVIDYLRIPDDELDLELKYRMKYSGEIERARDKGLILDVTDYRNGLRLQAINGEAVSEEDKNYVLTKPKKDLKKKWMEEMGVMDINMGQAAQQIDNDWDVFGPHFLNNP